MPQKQVFPWHAPVLAILQERLDEEYLTMADCGFSFQISMT